MASIALKRITRLLGPQTSAIVSLAPHAACVHVSRARSDYRRRVGRTGAPASPRPWAAPRRSRQALRHPVAGTAPRMAESSPDELLLRVNRAYGRPIVLTHIIGVAGAAALTAGSLFGANWLVTGIFAGTAALALWYVHQNENDHHAEVVEYELDPEVAQVYRRFVGAFQRFATSGSVWRVEPHRQARAKKGVGWIPRRSATARLGLPRRIKSNVVVPMLPGQNRRTLCFFPDRLLVYEKEMVWAVQYAELRVRAGDVRAAEGGEEAISGLNGFLTLEARTGVKEMFRCTDPAAATELASALRALAC